MPPSIFPCCYAQVVDAVSSSPESVANELFSAGLIPKEVRDKARIAAFSFYEKATHLLPAVKAKILADSSYQDFEKKYYRYLFINLACTHSLVHCNKFATK